MTLKFLVGTGALLVALAGCASTSHQERTATTAAAKPPCVTASRLPSSGQCAPGRSYSSTDLQRTGEVDVGPALQKLDPAITVHGR